MQQSDFLECFRYNEAANETTCLVCYKVYTGFLKHNLKRHLVNQHPDHGEASGVACTKRKRHEEDPPAKKVKEERSSREASMESSASRDLNTEQMQPNDFLEYFDYDEDTKITECLLCSTVFTSYIKQSLKRHFINQHQDQAKASGVTYKNQERLERSTTSEAPPAKKFKGDLSSREESMSSSDNLQTSTVQSEDFLQNFEYDEAAKKTKCLVCSKVFTGFHKQNLNRHFANQHPDQAKTSGVPNSSRERQKNYDKHELSSPAVKKGALSRGVFIQCCVSLVVFSLTPCSLFDSIAFRALTRIDCERHQIAMNKKNIVEFVRLAAYGVRLRIKKKVRNKLVSIKLDIATRHDRTMLSINSQFYCTLRKKIEVLTLGCIELAKRHKSAYLKAEVNKILDTFEIDRRNIYCFTCDNGADTIPLGKLLKRLQHDMNVAMREILETRMESDDEEDSDTDESEDEEVGGNEDFVAQVSSLFIDETPTSIFAVVRSAAHTLQLAVNDALENTGNARLDKIRSIVKNLKSSLYLDYVPAGFKRLKLKADQTQWNSLYMMIDSVLNQRHVLENLYDDLKDREDDRNDVLLSEDDFDFMKQFQNAFRPIFELTERLQTEEMATSQLLILWYKCKEAICKLDPETNIFVRPLLEAYDKRGETLMENIALATAAYVDPRVHHDKSSTKLLGRMEADIENRLCKVLKRTRSNKTSSNSNQSNAIPDEVDDDDFDKIFEAKMKHPTDEPCSGENAEEKQLKRKITPLGKQSRLAMKTNIFEHYEEMHNKRLIDDECFELVMTVLSAPATQVTVKRAFTALALVSETPRTNLKAEMIDDILVCALNQDVFMLIDFENIKL